MAVEENRWRLWSILLPSGLITAASGLLYLTGFAGFLNQEFVTTHQIESQLGFEATQPQAILLYVAISGIFGMLGTTLIAAGEEIGWRGLLVPELNKITNFTRASLISGGLEVVYHFPAMIFADYPGAGSLWYSMRCFSIMILSFRVIMTWFRLKAGRVWTAVFLHTAHNVFVQAIFTPLTYDTGPAEYLIAAVVFWRLRDRASEGKS